MDENAVRAVLSEDWKQAPLSPRHLATLRYLNALTREPWSVGPEDVDRALAAGVEPGALEQATLMVGLFSYMNRMVDAFAADITPEQAEVLAGFLDNAGSMAGHLSRVRPWERYRGVMPSRLTEQLAIIREGEGDCPDSLRRDIEARTAGSSGAQRNAVALPPTVEELVSVMAADAHGVQDRHIQDLLAEGWSEEAIYEMIFVASFGACVGRMERSLGLLADR